MSMLRILKWSAVVLACVNWVLPLRELAGAAPPALAGPPKHQTAGTVVDLSLGAGGRLSGQLLDAQGTPMPHKAVVLQRIPGGEAVRAVTDGEGRFAVEQLTGGMVHISSGDASMLCRCWAANTAPPSAVREILLVSHDTTTRGQRPIGEVLFSNPVLLGLIIAAAIAIPIAVHNSKDSAS